MEEKELISQIINKNDQAFKELVDLYADRVHNTVVSFTQNDEDAEDITQDVFVEIYQSISKFRNDSSLFTWIYKIAVSKSLDYLKAKKRKKRFSFFTSLFGEDASLVYDKPHFDHPGVLLENKEYAKVLFHAISKLPEKQQTVFTLHKVEGLSYQEIAEVIQTTTSSVESLMFRAKQNLQIHLKDYYENNF
ncbi:MAG: RNA polymerase sigma factor [Bacteroidota bacterium]